MSSMKKFLFFLAIGIALTLTLFTAALPRTASAQRGDRATGRDNRLEHARAVSLGICGHEMQHGITERTANLTYSGESGALNESWSDVFGAMTERYARGENSNTWLIGEQSYTPGTSGDALRYMSNPHQARNGGYTADDDPDHYSERYTGTGDNGGVHINSGIANKAFYLLAVGGTHHRGGSMTGIGSAAAARIWYRALTSYMTSSTNFKGARTATLNAAAALYGSGGTNYNAVANAWALCGVN
jgi:Zn-dependent metalloprotease